MTAALPLPAPASGRAGAVPVIATCLDAPEEAAGPGEATRRVALALAELQAALAIAADPNAALRAHQAALRDLVEADGVAILLADGAVLAGATPVLRDVQCLAPPLPDTVLAISLPAAGQPAILWFRAAAPPWSAAARAAAQALRTAWLEAALRHAEVRAAEREAARARCAFLMAEQDHRLKNILATVQALVRHSRHHAETLDGFVTDFESRLRAMATAHRLLTASRWDGLRLRALVEEELCAYGDGAVTDRIVTAGPDLTLRPQAGQALSLALHELATNAAKHGALAVPTGRLAVEWALTERGLALSWRESGGPPVRGPRRRGFGLTLIERSLAYELGGASSLDFAPEGLRCAIMIPLASLGG